jgi:hypothetical protein
MLMTYEATLHSATRGAPRQDLLGGYGSTSRLSRALGTSQQHLYKIWRGLPEYLVALAELLEALPKEQWPERWIKTKRGPSSGPAARKGGGGLAAAATHAERHVTA